MTRLNKIDLLAGLFVVLIGALAIVEALNFDLGTSQRMGPGYFPFYVGVLMVLIGIGIVLEGLKPHDEAFEFGQLPTLRALLLILAAVIGFALTIERFGLFPASALAVFLGTLADTRTPIVQKLALAVAVPLVSVLIFKMGLAMQVDIVRWNP